MPELYIDQDTGKEYNVSDDMLDKFMSDHPNAVLKGDESSTLESEESLPQFNQQPNLSLSTNDGGLQGAFSSSLRSDPREQQYKYSSSWATPEMYIDTDSGEVFNVTPDKADAFLKDHPKALSEKEYNEELKKYTQREEAYQADVERTGKEINREEWNKKYELKQQDAKFKEEIEKQITEKYVEMSKGQVGAFGGVAPELYVEYEAAKADGYDRYIQNSLDSNYGSGLVSNYQREYKDGEQDAMMKAQNYVPYKDGYIHKEDFEKYEDASLKQKVVIKDQQRVDELWKEKHGDKIAMGGDYDEFVKKHSEIGATGGDWYQQNRGLYQPVEKMETKFHDKKHHYGVYGEKVRHQEKIYSYSDYDLARVQKIAEEEVQNRIADQMRGGGGINTGFSATPVGAIGTGIYNLLTDEYAIDPNSMAKTEQVGDRFYAVANKDGSLIDWKEYYEELPQVTDGTPVTGDLIEKGNEVQDILKNNPGSYVIDTPDKLKKFALDNDMTVKQALNEIHNQTNVFNAHQHQVDLINWSLKKDQSGMTEAEYLKYYPKPTLTPAMSLIIDQVNLEHEYLQNKTKEATESIKESLYEAWGANVDKIRAAREETEKFFEMSKEYGAEEGTIAPELQSQYIKAKSKEDEIRKQSKLDLSKVAEKKSELVKETEKQLANEFSASEREVAREIAKKDISLGIDRYGAYQFEEGSEARQLANKLVDIKTKMLDINLSDEEVDELWSEYETVWNQMEKEGDQYWDFNTGKFVRKEKASSEVVKWNKEVAADALQLSEENDMENLEAIRNQTYYELQEALRNVLIEDKVGDWQAHGLMDFMWQGKMVDIDLYRGMEMGDDGKVELGRGSLFSENIGASMPTNLPLIPGNGTRAIIDFNDKLRQWVVTNKAYMLNQNPETFEATSFSRHAIEGLGGGVGMRTRRDDNDIMIRSFVENMQSKGGKVSDLGIERLSQTFNEEWTRPGFEIVGFVGSFALNPVGKIKTVGNFGKLGKIKNPFAIGGRVDATTRSIQMMKAPRFIKTPLAATMNGGADVMRGVAYDKFMGVLDNEHQDFGAGMWFSMGIGGYFTTRWMMGLSALPASTSNAGVSTWKSFTNGLNNVVKRTSYPFVSTPIRRKATELGLGSAVSTGVMLGSELAVTALAEDHSLLEAWDEVLNPITGYDPVTGEEQRMSTSHKLLHTYVMMLAGHLGHGRTYTGIKDAIQLTARNYKNKKSLPKDYKKLGVTREEINESVNNGTDKVLRLDLKKNAIANLRMEKYGTADANAGPLTKAELAKIDRSIENVFEATNMEMLKKLVIENENYEINLKNVNRELYYLNNRLQRGIQEGKTELNFQDADMISKLPPQYLQYMSDMMTTTKGLDVSASAELNRQLQQSGHIMKTLRENTSDAVWGDPVERQKAYEKVNEYVNAQQNLNNLRVKKNSPGEIVTDAEIKLQEENVNKLSDEVGEIMIGGELQKRYLEAGEKVSKLAGLKPQIAENQEEYTQLGLEAGLSLEQLQGTNALYFRDKNDVIIVNKKAGKEQGLFSQITHETLHPLTDVYFKRITHREAANELGLTEQVDKIEEVYNEKTAALREKNIDQKKKEKQIKKIEADRNKEIEELYNDSGVNSLVETRNQDIISKGREFKNSLTPEERKAVDERLDDYRYISEKNWKENWGSDKNNFKTNSEGEVIVKNGEVEFKEHMYIHELPTALHEAITLNKVKYNDSTWKKLGKSLTSPLKNLFPKAEWQSGQEVYDFVKSYSVGTKRNYIPLEVKRKLKQYKKLQKEAIPTEMAASKDAMSPKVKEIQDRAIAKTKEWKAAEGEKKAQLLNELKEINAEKQKVIEQEKLGKEREEAVKKDKINSINQALLIQPSNYQKFINGLVEINGRKMSQEEWRNFLLTEIDPANPEQGLVLESVAKLWEPAIQAKFKGSKVTTPDNKIGVNRSTAIQMLRDQLNSRRFSWDKLLEFDPQKTQNGNAVQLSGYMNGIINNSYKSVLENINKAKETKSLDETFSGSEREVYQPESTEMSPEDYADLSILNEQLEKISSTAKNVVNLSSEKQIEIMDDVADIVKEQLPNIKKGDYTFFQRKRKGEKPGPRFTEVVQEKLKKDILENIPKSGGAGKIKPEYRKFLEDKLAPELLKINKENPELLRNRKWDIFYEERVDKETGKVQKYKQSELTKDPSLQRKERIDNLASQRVKYNSLEPTTKEIADYLTTKGRPNEMRLAVGKLLAEKIAKDALSTALVESKRLTEAEKILIEGESAINKIADKIGVDPSISFSNNKRNFELSKKIAGPVEMQKENLGLIISKIKSTGKEAVQERNLEVYQDNVLDFMHTLADHPEMKIEAVVRSSFGGKGNIESKPVLNEITKQWSKVFNQAPVLKKGLKKLTSKDLARYLENSYLEQTFKKGNSSELLGIEESNSFSNKERLYSFAESLTKLVNERWISKDGYSNNYEFVQDVLQRYKNSLAGNARIGNGGLNWVIEGLQNVLVETGIKKDVRDNLFKNQEQLLEVLVKPVIGEKAFRESVKIQRGEKGDINGIFVDGKKIKLKSFSQSGSATKKILDLTKNQSFKNGVELNSNLKQALKESKEYADLNKEIIIEDVTALKNLLEKGEIDIRDIDMYMKTIVSNMNASLRSAYHIDSIIPGKSKNPKDYRYEHNPPVRTLQVELARFVKGDITEAQLREIFKDTSASIIPLEVDKIINIRNKDTKPLEYTSRWDRYLNEFTYGMFKEPVIIFENGKIKKIGEYQAEAYKGVHEAIAENKTNAPSFSRDINKNAAVQTKNAEMFDKALANARKRNQPIKKARVFDFDDTLARTNSRVIYSKPNTTGKPSPKLKAVVLAGGPGSGKSSIVKGLGLEKQGYKIVNQDISLEWAKKLVGLPESEANYDAVQRSVRSEMGALARKIAEKKLDQYTTQGKGVILDGTGASLKATRAKVEALKDQGYDVKMVYVETSKDIALERNRARKERSLKDFIVEKTWDSVNANKAEYAKEFGEDFFEVNTDNLKPGEVPAEFVQAVNERLNATERGKLEAGGFAELGDKLAGEGAQFDFREFSKVIDGKEGPLLNVAKMINEAKGDRNMFVLTARPPEAAASIHEFLKSMGLDIPIENITGLADGAPAAKARWMVEKAAEGYNDFYFADDHIGNVQAVGEALKGLQVKSKVQRAKPKESEKQLTEDLNKELSKNSGKDVSFSFDTKKQLDWKKTKEFYRNEFNTSTKVGDQKVNIRLTEVEKGSWELDFGVGEKKFEDSIGKLGITGKGDAYRIFSVVGNGVTDLINKQGLKEINFSALEPSRARVYETFTKLWAKRLGWEFEADVHVDGSGSYTITKPNFKSKKRGTILSKIRGEASFSLDTKRDLKWKQDIENDRTFISKFKIGDKKYEIILSDASGRGNVEFAFARLVGKDRVFDMIGDGNAYEVVSIVTNGLVDLIKSNRIPIKEIIFSADVPSRARVYERIAKMWAEELGWNMELYEGYSDGGADFLISRQKWAQKLIDQKVDKRGFEMQASDPAPIGSEIIEEFTPEEQAAVMDVWRSQQQNEGVRQVVNQVDIKGEVQQERASFSRDVDREFNEVLQSSSGVEWYKEFSPAKAQVVGEKKGKRKLILPYSAEDFMGLIYPTLGKGAVGEANFQWYKKNLLDPYNRGIENLSTDRVNLMNDFKALKKQLNVPKNLRKKNKTQFTNEQAVRVYLWDKVGTDIPGISKTDLRELKSVVENDPVLKTFADQMLSLTKGDGYSTPDKNWLAGTITTDIIDLINTTKRAKYLAEWKENVDMIYSEKNLNKLEAIHGSRYREALENTLARMKAGKNRIEGGNRLNNAVLNYINQAQGSIMFLNDRSALLQTISAGNFINWTFNNPVRASKALLNVPQYAKDFVKIMNSDYLVDRRNGLKLNIAENEIADAAKTSTNKAKAIINYIIEKGYVPTKFADSFAIASGGATFYRNRINDLMKKFPEMKLSKAEEIAFKEFREASEKSQQSSDPSKISQQQSGDMGRLLLQFVNTPMQYTRLQKRAVQDIINNRGSRKEHISKIIYYGFMQNLWFNFLQQGAFAIFGGDMESDEEERRMYDVSNGMLDSILRGSGLGGMTISVLKNVGYDMWKESKKDRPDYQASAEELLGFSPSLKRKYTHFKNAIYPFNSEKRRQEIFDKGFSLDNPAWRSLAKVVEGATNLPADRMFQKIENVGNALDAETDNWMKVANFLGWPEWQLQSKSQKDFDIAKKDPSVLNKTQQIEILRKYGLNGSQIKALKNEELRVQKILELQNKTGKYYQASPAVSKEEQQAKDKKAKEEFYRKRRERLMQNN